MVPGKANIDDKFIRLIKPYRTYSVFMEGFYINECIN